MASPNKGKLSCAPHLTGNTGGGGRGGTKNSPRRVGTCHNPTAAQRDGVNLGERERKIMRVLIMHNQKVYDIRALDVTDD